MENGKIKEQADEIIQHGKNLYDEGKRREVIFYNRGDKVIFRTRLTNVIIAGVLLAVTGLVSIPLFIVALVVAMFAGIRAELVEVPA